MLTHCAAEGERGEGEDEGRAAGAGLTVLGAGGLTTLLVTHDLHEAALLADRVIALAGPPLRVLLDVPVSLPAPRGRRDLYDPRVGELVRALRAALDLDTTP